MYNFEETKKSIQEVIGDVYCPTCPNEKRVYLETNKTSRFYDGIKCKACSQVLNIPFNEQKPTILLSGCGGTHRFARKTSRDYLKGTPSPILKKFSRQSWSSSPELEPKKLKTFPFMA